MITSNHSKSRRNFLKAGIAYTLLSKTSRAELPRHPDIVVIGAGAAGLSATRTLQEGGLDVLLLESSNRIGGRAITDTSIFGIPYDLGASWLHTAHLNPFVSYGQQHGFEVYPEAGDATYFIENRRAEEDQIAAVNRLYRSASLLIPILVTRLGELNIIGTPRDGW